MIEILSSMDLVNDFCPTRYVLYSFQPSIKSRHIKLKKTPAACPSQINPPDHGATGRARVQEGCVEFPPGCTRLGQATRTMI